MSTPEPSPAMIAHLERFLRTAEGDEPNLCAYLQGMLGFFMMPDSPWTGDNAAFDFGDRVIAREGGLTMANFLAEARSTYCPPVYNKIIGAINNPKFSERLEEAEQQRGLR